MNVEPPVRFYERVRSSKHGEGLRAFFGNPDQPPVVIDVQNIADYYWEQAEDKHFEAKDFPNLAPPFEQFWLEYQKPKQKEWYGLGVWGREFSPEEAVKEGAQWELSTRLFFSTNKGHVLPVCNATLRVKPNGMTEDEMGFTADPWFHSVMSKALVKLGEEDEWAGRIADGFVVQDLQPFWLAVSFLHCKNVLMVNHEPPRLARGLIRKGVKPRVRFHTLEIEPMKKILKREGQRETTGLRRALHVCRGHFADYSQGNGLFGKFKGTYWREAHLRGRSEEGVVVKDYEIKKPQNANPPQ